MLIYKLCSFKICLLFRHKLSADVPTDQQQCATPHNIHQKHIQNTDEPWKHLPIIWKDLKQHVTDSDSSAENSFLFPLVQKV